MDFGMVLMGAMTEVEPERVDAGEEQRFQHFGRSTRRSDGGDDLGRRIAPHGSSGLWAASGDQNRSDVIDVGAGRPGANEVAGSGKETVAVMRDEMGSRVKIGGASPRKGVWRDKCSSRVFGSVDAITIGRKRENAGLAGHGDGESEQEFGIAPAAPGLSLADRDGGLAAGQQHRGRRGGEPRGHAPAGGPRPP